MNNGDKKHSGIPQIRGKRELWSSVQGRTDIAYSMRVEVECYSGFRGNERPVRVRLGEQILEVAEVEDRWYSPGETYFRVKVEGGDRYVLKHVEAQDQWSLEAYRSGAS